VKRQVEILRTPALSEGRGGSIEIDGNTVGQPSDSGFLYPWRDYSTRNRHVFVEEISNFIRAADEEELSAIRKSAQSRRKAPLKVRKRGRPRRTPAENASTGSAQTVNEPQLTDALGWDVHSSFRDICMACGDLPHLRPVFLGQVLLFIDGATKDELISIRKCVANRERDRGDSKKPGRPGALSSNKMMYQAKIVAWRRIVDRRSTEEIAEELGISLRKNASHDEKLNLRRRLLRLKHYLAAAIWHAVPVSFTRELEDSSRLLRPGVLDHKPLQQLIRHHTGLPFRTHPEESKRVVQTLWPRGEGAYLKLECLRKAVRS
jgi:hypothetical protein